MCGDKGFLSQD